MSNEDKRVIRESFDTKEDAETALIDNEGSQVYAIDQDVWIFNNAGTFEYTWGPRSSFYGMLNPELWDVGETYAPAKIVYFDSGSGVFQIAVSNIDGNTGNDPLDNVDVAGPWTVYPKMPDLITWILLNKANG